MAGTCFGSALAVAGTGRSAFALPLPYLAEAWQYTAGMLARMARADSDDLDRDWLTTIRGEVGRLLTSIHGLPRPTIVQGPAGPVLMIRFGERHAVVVAVAAGIGTCDTSDAEQAVTAIAPGVELRAAADQTVQLPSDCEIVRVVVAAPVGPLLAAPADGLAFLTFEDLGWITGTCERADELWAFFNETIISGQETDMFGWEVSNTWQFWKANGQALHRAGRAPTGIFVTPHQVGDQEWQQAADHAPLDWALYRLGLPARRSLRAVDGGSSPVRVLTADYTLWVFALLQPESPQNGVVLAETQRAGTPTELREFAVQLVGTASFVASHEATATAAALRECGLDHLVLSFTYDADAADPIVLGGGVLPEISFRWNARLQEIELEQPGFVQRRIGSLLVQVLRRLPTAGGAVETLRMAWRDAPRMLVVTAYDAPLEQARDLPRPHPAPAWAISDADRRIGRLLRDEGYLPGQRDRVESRKIELEVIVPWLGSEVRDQFTRFDRISVVRRAATEIEAVTSARQAEQRERINRSQLPTVRPLLDQLDPTTDVDTKLAQQSAILATLLELALAAEGSGTTVPDEVEWYQLLALAGLFVDSTLRCDSLLHEMSSDVTKISDNFEITVESAEATAIDITAFNEARLRHRRGPIQDYEQQPAGLDGEAIMDTIDPAMLSDLGCTARTLVQTCAVISAWPVTDQEPLADVAVDELYDAVARELEIDVPQAQAAISALTLSRESLRAEGVQPWRVRSRDHRLMARPIIEIDRSAALLLPWNTEVSGKVLVGYLTEGLSPWPQARLNQYPTLRTAIHQVRNAHTRVLEDQVDAELRRLGFVVRSRIKPEDAHTVGLPQLPGEVDHLAVRADGGVLWVIDDKDPAAVFTSAEFARNVKQFFDVDKGEAPKLQKKIDVVAENSEAVAQALGAAAPTSVRGLFVTRSPIPAAFANAESISFTTLRDLPVIVEE